MNREQAQDLIASILERPLPGELQVKLSGVERLGTRFNDCAISQNALKSQHNLTLSARLGQKRTSLDINRLDDPELIERSIERVFSNCAHMPDDEELMPAPGERLETVEHAFSEATEQLGIDEIGERVAAACR